VSNSYVERFSHKNIRKFLTQVATETLVLSLVISHLDYCYVILYGMALYDLHWLPIKARIQLKILVYIYNCMSRWKCTNYLTDLLTPKVQKRSLRSSSFSVDSYEVPFNKCKTFSDRSTIVTKLWNDLPLNIRQCSSVDSFKKHLKTHFFRDYFNLF